MEISKILSESIKDIISSARYAPSAHNTQPYLVRVSGSQVIVSVDKKYQLKDGDPTGRQTVIGLGIFIEAIILTAREFGLAGSGVNLVGSNVCEITFEKSDKIKSTEILNLLRSRTSDRSIYTRDKVLPHDTLKLLLSASKTNRVTSRFITEKAIIDEVAKLTSMGVGIALSSPEFRKELCRYLVQPWSKKNRGISVKSLYIPLPFALLEPYTLRLGLRLGFEKRAERARWESAAGLLLITSPGDMRDDWFAAGREYLNICLKIEELGLSQATSASAVEASNFHEDVENLLGTKERLQAVVRFGYGKKIRSHSPRVSVKDLLST